MLIRSLLSAYCRQATGIRTLLKPAAATPFNKAWLTAGLPQWVSCDAANGAPVWFTASSELPKFQPGERVAAKAIAVAGVGVGDGDGVGLGAGVGLGVGVGVGVATGGLWIGPALAAPPDPPQPAKIIANPANAPCRIAICACRAVIYLSHL